MKTIRKKRKNKEKEKKKENKNKKKKEKIIQPLIGFHVESEGEEGREVGDEGGVICSLAMLHDIIHRHSHHLPSHFFVLWRGWLGCDVVGWCVV